MSKWNVSIITARSKALRNVNLSDDIWKLILILSAGAITVFAQIPEKL